MGADFMPPTPAGTYGLRIEMWSDVYAVAANWSEAASPVWTYLGDEWMQSGRQVADYRHSPRAALVDVLLTASGADLTSTDLCGATEI